MKGRQIRGGTPHNNFLFLIRSPPGGHRGKNMEGKATGSDERNSVVSCSQFPVHKLFKTVPVSVYIFF